jgi:hypothetical protein
MRAAGSMTISTVGGRGIYVAFGVFVFLIAALPTSIVGVQWLDYVRHGGEEPNTGAGAIVPGALIVLFGLWLTARRDLLTVDPVARTLTWKLVAFGVTLKSESWRWDEVDTIEVVSNSAIKNQGYSALVTGPRGTRTLLDYLHSASLFPDEIREISRLLGKPIKKPERR